jgi:hypothetical protein
MRHRIYYRDTDGVQHGAITSDGAGLLRRILDSGGIVLDAALLPRRPDRRALELLGVMPDVATSVAECAPSMSDAELARWARDRADIAVATCSPAMSRSDYMRRVRESWLLVSALTVTGKLSCLDAREASASTGRAAITPASNPTHGLDSDAR